MTVQVGGNLGGVGNASDNEVSDRTDVYDVTVRRAAVNGAHVITFQTEDIFVGKVLLGGRDRESPHPEVIVVAEHDIPRDSRATSGGLAGFLIIYGAGSCVGAGTRGDIFSVHDINIPAQFIILRAIGIIAQRNGEIERKQTIHSVGGPDGVVENLRGVEHHRGI